MAEKPFPRPAGFWRWLALAALLVFAAGIWIWWSGSTTQQTNTGPPTGPAWFEDATDDVGLAFVHDPGPVDGRYFMPQIVGSGAALFDFDDDGRLDIYLLNNGGPKGRPNVLYHQLPDGKFRDVSRGSGLDVAGYGMGVAIGDVNNDERPDVVVTEFGHLRLFLNDGEGRFAPQPESGLDSPMWGTSACFVDYDRDGWLDLAVANYLDYDPAWPCTNAAGERDYCHPKVFQGVVAKLFRNCSGEDPSSGVRFEDVTTASGLARFPGPGLGIASGDFNGDGWPDIFIANDAYSNHLWINRQNGTFEQEAVPRGVAYDAVGRPLANMGVALGDTRGAGMFDVFVTHLPEETNTLWRQGPRGLFVDRSAATGLMRPKWRATGFGTAFADFDQDGHLDLAIVNGRVVQQRNAAKGNHWGAYAERNQLFAGEGSGEFRDISPDNPDLCETPNVARALAVGDVDGDGALDLLFTCTAGRARLLKNVSQHGHWLLIRALDPRLKRDALGAEVTVVTSGQRRVGWVNPGQSFLTSHDPRVHFGLGSASSIDAVEILWPDGLLESFPGGPADRKLVLRRGEGTEVSATSSTKSP